eukprot:6456798-Amphidinium_carterae.2
MDVDVQTPVGRICLARNVAMTCIMTNSHIAQSLQLSTLHCEDWEMIQNPFVPQQQWHVMGSRRTEVFCNSEIGVAPTQILLTFVVSHLLERASRSLYCVVVAVVVHVCVLVYAEAEVLEFTELPYAEVMTWLAWKFYE